MTDLARIIFSGMQVLIDQEWVANKAVVVENGKIKAFLELNMIRHHLPAQQYIFSKECYLIPGLIDLHIHGAAGADVMDGQVEALTTIGDALAAEGVTGYLATTMTAEVKQIEQALTAVRSAALKATGAAILGVHLEGPFIAPAKMGAQHSKHMALPNVALLKKWQELSGGMIKIVTLAPELPGALALIAALQKMDVVGSIGHTNATYAETLQAIASGCTNATHLFNAMSGIHQREPGAALALLLSDTVTAELIVDGLHLHPAMVALAWKMKGKDRLMLVSDAMRAKCMGDGEYDLGGQVVQVRKKHAVLADGTLAGSTLRLPEAIKHMVQYTDCGLAAAVHMATATPAKVLGLLPRKGTIEVGKDADLVVLDANLNVKLTMRDGNTLFTHDCRTVV